jgi:hypothetical protein
LERRKLGFRREEFGGLTVVSPGGDRGAKSIRYGCEQRRASGSVSDRTAAGAVLGERDVNVGWADGLTCVIAGAMITLYEVRKMSPRGLALILSGGSLIYRGLSSRCTVYEQLLDIDTSEKL